MSPLRTRGVIVGMLTVVLWAGHLAPSARGDTAGTIDTVAGGSTPGAHALDSTLFQPYGVAAAPDGRIYVADTYDNQIKVVDQRNATLTTLAGTGDAGLSGDGGPARSASFNFPMGLAVAPGGSVIVADTWNDRVRRIDGRTGIVTTVAGSGPDDATHRSCHDAGGPGTGAVLAAPHAVATDGGGDVFIADTGCNVVERIVLATGRITVVAGVEGRSGASGDGPAAARPLAAPLSVALDSVGNPVVTDTSNRLFYVNLLDHAVTLFAHSRSPVTVAPGDRVTIGTTSGPTTLGMDAGALLMTDARMRVRRLDWATAALTTVGGTLSYPAGVIGDGSGGVVVIDRGTSRVLDVRPSGMAPVAGRPNAHGPALGDGLPATRAQLDWPRAVAVGPRGVYIADSYDLRIRRVNPDGTIVTVVGDAAPCVRMGVASNDCEPRVTAADDAAGASFPMHINDGTGLAASGNGLVAFIDAGRVYVLNDGGAAATVLSRPLPPGRVRLVAPDQQRLGAPVGLAFSGPSALLISDQLSNRVDRLDLTTGRVAILAGPNGSTGAPDGYVDGPAATARFAEPTGLAVAPDGSVYVADTGNNRVRRIAGGMVTTLAGDGVEGFAGDGGPALLASFAAPTDVTVGPRGSVLVLDWGNERVRMIDAAGTVSTVAGSGLSRVGRACGSTVPCGHFRGDGGPAVAASLYFPLEGATFQALGPAGQLYIADTMNNRVRLVTLPFGR